MASRKINLQQVYNIPDEYPWIAVNQSGVLNGFLNAPLRDYKTGEWIDSVTGDYGFFIPYTDWEISVRETKNLSDTRAYLKTIQKNKEKSGK
jgi:hypothetical protein